VKLEPQNCAGMDERGHARKGENLSELKHD